VVGAADDEAAGIDAGDVLAAADDDGVPVDAAGPQAAMPARATTRATANHPDDPTRTRFTDTPTG
jgi:hypothetical protein